MPRQLPVWSPLSLGVLWSGVRAALGRDRAAVGRLRARLLAEYSARAAFLTDSGTTALALALRVATAERPERNRIAMPGFACPDLLTAADAVGVPVVLYDVDPVTLAPCRDDLAACLAEPDVGAIVVVHAFGMAVDVPAIATLAAARDAILIEDAAQGAGGRLNGRSLGSFGDLAILSFGRGKGRTGGGGGALLVHREELAVRATVAAGALRSGGRGIRAVMQGAVQWVLGRPRLFGIAATVAGARIGETRYSPPSEGAEISAASAAVVDAGWESAEREARYRRASAAAWRVRLRHLSHVAVPASEAGARAEDGALRLPVLVNSDRELASPALGCVRGYPRTLAEYAGSPASVACAVRALPGASDLARRLVTLPLHSRISATVPTAITAHLELLQ